MATRHREIILGVDVSKSELVIYRTDEGRVDRIENGYESIEEYLNRLGDQWTVVLEATGRYHETLEVAALERGAAVYRVDGYRVSRFRDATGERAKTDPHDARLLVRYLEAMRSRLRPVKYLNERERLVWRLVKRRAAVVKAGKALRQSLKDLPEMAGAISAMEGQLKALTLRLEQETRRQARKLGWADDIKRLRTIQGIGPLTSVALRALAARGTFDRSDQFIAFLGLDVRVRESRSWRGKRKLTKKGDSEIRRLLFNAARSAAYRSRYFGGLKEAYMARGLSEIAASVVIARKLARIAFAVLRDQTEYSVPEQDLPRMA